MANQWEGIEKKLHDLNKRPDGWTSSEWSLVVERLRSLQKRRNTPFNPDRHKEETKSVLAKRFLTWFFVMLLVILIYVPIYNLVMVKLMNNSENILNAKDVFVMASGQMGSLLGFVLGYYFKGQD